MLPWQHMCNSKHFSKSDITSYDNGIGFSVMDICKIHVKTQALFESKLNSHTQSAQF